MYVVQIFIYSQCILPHEADELLLLPKYLQSMLLIFILVPSLPGPIVMDAGVL